MAETPDAIHRSSGDYDLEHVGATEKLEFFVALLTRLKPGRILELVCGNRRVTMPLRPNLQQMIFCGVEPR